MELSQEDLARLSEDQLKFLYKYKLNDDQLGIAMAVDKEARRQGVNPAFVWPMVWQESQFDPFAKSKKDAYGVMQLTEDTAKGLNVNREDTDENIRGGISLLKELMSNPKIGNDPYKVLAGYNASTAERNKFYESGNLEELPPETLKHMYLVSSHYGGDLPNVNFEQPNQEEAPRDVTSTVEGNKNSSAPTPGTAGNPPAEDTKLEQALALGTAGLGVGALGGAGLQRGAGYLFGHPVAQMVFDATRDNRAAETVAGEAPAVQPTTPEGYPISELPPSAPKSQAVTSTPASGAQTRTERNVQGAMDESGATGRERGTAYNTRTAQEAARAEMAANTLGKVGLNTKAVLANFPDVTALPNGTLVSKQTGQQISEAQARQIEIEAQRARDQQILDERAAQRRTTQQRAQGMKAATAAGAEWQKMAAQAAEMQKSSDATVRARGQALFNKAVDIWSKGIPGFGGRLSGFGAGVGGGAGFAAPYALEQFQNGDTQGALKTLGIGVGTGAALATVPARSVPVVNAGLQGLEAYQRGKAGDYVGAGTSALGAVAPYVAPFALGPEVGIPVGLATAVGAPVVNYVKDKFFPYKSVLEGSQ